MANQDNSPTGYTCPWLDEVISFIDNIESEEISYHAKQDICKTLEKIRNTVSELRTWGNEQYCRVEELEKTNYDLETKLEDANDEIDWLANQIKELEKKMEAILHILQ